MKSLKLPNGMSYGYGPDGLRVCLGAKMGRCDEFPANRNTSCKLRLVKLRWVDGDYDEGVTYWGNTGKDSLYWAHRPHDFGLSEINVFVRAIGRRSAKDLIKAQLPNARFYR